jgi:hypothetical protein
MPVLPDELRERIIGIFLDGHSIDQVFQIVRKEASLYVSSDEQLRRCLSSLKGKASLRQKRSISDRVYRRRKPAIAPAPKTYRIDLIDTVVCASSILSKSSERIEGLFEIEDCHELRARIAGHGANQTAKEPYFKAIAVNLLERLGFSKLMESPGQGVPFDFLGSKDGRPCIIELKGSLKVAGRPDAVQLARMEDLIHMLNDLKIEPYLIQIHLSTLRYCLWTPAGVSTLFKKTDKTLGKDEPLQRAVQWVRARIKEAEEQGANAPKCDVKAAPKPSTTSPNRKVVRFGNVMHPPGYVQEQIRPCIRDDKMDAEVVWTYVLAKKYEKDVPALTKLLCGSDVEPPTLGPIWLEPYLHPTRERAHEKNKWKTRADLAIGHIVKVPDRKLQIQAGGDWICITESKWFSDMHPNEAFPYISQLAQTIDHALLMHDGSGRFPERVYVTLLTPRYFTSLKNPFSNMQYYEKFKLYQEDKEALKRDLSLCPLPFLEFDKRTLLRRVDVLRLNWVTFEEALGVDHLVEPCVPGKYRTSRTSWDQVFTEIDEEDVLKYIREA